MRRPYLITYGEDFPRNELLYYIDQDSRFGSWFYSMPGSFFLYSSVDANAIDSFIKSKIGQKYRYFISEVSLVNHQGWMPQAHWDTLKNNGFDRVYNLMFNGYCRDISHIPHVSGVYCVSKGTYSVQSNTVTITELLYIGGATDINQRLNNPEDIRIWQERTVSPELLWYSFAPLDADVDRCVAALVFLNQPTCNTAGRDRFTYQDTVVNIQGRATVFLSGGSVEKFQQRV